MSSTWPQELDSAIDGCGAHVIEVRRYLHAHPEPSGEEHGTSLYLSHVLEELDFPNRFGPDERGVLIDSPAPPEAARVGLRADMDALRIHERNEVPYRSRTPGLMHACGHDGHTATVLGAVLGLRAAARAGSLPWPVAWRAIFQPAEETGEGARDMIAVGALEGVRALLSMHMDPSRSVGRIGLRAGALTAACDEVEFVVYGRGGHAARPHESLDPILAAAQLVNSLYLGIPRSIDSQDPVVLTIGQVIAGDNPNVIPEQAILRGTLRTLGGLVRLRTKEQIRHVARGIAEITSTRIEVRFEEGPDSVMNDPGLVEVLRAAALDLLGPDRIDQIPRPSMGGEDFSYYQARVPVAMFRLGCSSPGVGDAPLHSARFDLDERALIIGAKVLARAVVLLSDPSRTEVSG